MGKDSFIIYKSFYEPLKTLSNDQMGRLFKAIFEYQINEIVDVEQDIKMAFEFFKNQFSLDEKKWQKTVKERSIAGKKGAEKRWKAKDNKNSNCYKPMASVTNIAVNDNDNDNVNENENENYNSKDNNNIYKFFEKNFGRTIAPVEYEKINEWLLLFKNQKDIICHGIELCVLQDKKNFAYLEGIFRNWESQQYKTLAQIQENEKTKQNEPKVPKWLEENNEATIAIATEEEQQAMNDLLEGITT